MQKTAESTGYVSFEGILHGGYEAGISRRGAQGQLSNIRPHLWPAKDGFGAHTPKRKGRSARNLSAPLIPSACWKLPLVSGIKKGCDLRVPLCGRATKILRPERETNVERDHNSSA